MATEFVMPEGMRWCPECNGDGEVWTMDGTPNLNEHVYACTFPGCAEGKGIVPIGVPANEGLSDNGTPVGTTDDTTQRQ